MPDFPGVTRRLHWSFPDPSSFRGTESEKLQKTREVHDMIESNIREFIKKPINY